MQTFQVIPSTRVKIPSLDDLARPDYIEWDYRQKQEEAIRQIQNECPPAEAKKYIDLIHSFESNGFVHSIDLSILSGIPVEYKGISNTLMHLKICVDSPQAIPLIDQVSPSVPGFAERTLNKARYLWYLLFTDNHYEKEKYFARDLWGNQAYEDLRDAYKHHIERNRKRVDGDGANAICKTHMVRLVPRRSGLASYWWCPICHDDDPVFCHAKTVRGILGNAAPKEDGVFGSVLKLNISAKISQQPVFFPLELDEIYISPRTDCYDVEKFLILYTSYNKPLRPLRKIKCYISPKAGLTKNSENMLRDHFGPNAFFTRKSGE